MAFADPQTVTINAVANSLKRVSSDRNAGTFQVADGTVKLKVSHQYGKRSRRASRLEHSKMSPDPFVPANSNKVDLSVTLVVDQPMVGYTITEIKQVVDGFLAYLSASSGAALTQLLGGEN